MDPITYRGEQKLDRELLLALLNQHGMACRLEALASLKAEPRNRPLFAPQGDEVNNHVHTFYSFSPYSPSAVIWCARMAGLEAVGSIDHDSIAAAQEIREAGRILGMGTTAGCELRVNFSKTEFEGRRLNNPDSVNIVYITIHGISENRVEQTAAFLKPIQQERNRRNRRMTEEMNRLILPLGLEPLEFDTDIYAQSEAARGGTVTERHILYALARAVTAHVGKGERVLQFLERLSGESVSDPIRAYLLDEQNPHYLYDLLGFLKGYFLPRFFIQPNEAECISVYDAVRFADEIGGIAAYAYLGDVTHVLTGDKRVEKFEDDFIDELIPALKEIGFRAISYMPPRNSRGQLRRLRKLCAAAELMEISGVDINSSRQQFNCPEIVEEEFSHLIGAAWALILHERLAAWDERYALFHRENPLASLPLHERCARYGYWGKLLHRTGKEARPEHVDF